MYFKKFPNVLWNQRKLVDITRRAALIDKFKGNPYVFLPYTIREQDTIESIAYNYYGDPKMSWLIIVANNIIDVHSDFWKSQKPFESLISAKYKEQAERSTGRYDADEYIPMTEREVVEWTQNETITDNIIHYFSVANKDVIVSKRTWEEFPDGEFFPLRIYDYEDQLNEQKRNIVLISKNYVNQLNSELERVLND